ncbi:MAG: hypothetical protein KIS81_11060 [Maricaulaceae bacterium]|nr:hypothetical protein [Maricaulaceae bacterium]
MCGGFANVACVEAADYCAVPMVLAANPNATGVCTPRPQVCTRDYRPHCGADGRTYSNACVAASEGVNVVSAGYCPGDEPETEGK